MTSFRLFVRRLQSMTVNLTKYGISGFIDDILNHQREWSLNRNSSLRSELAVRTSVSDQDSYRLICEIALESQDVFRKFRSCIEYREVLEHVSRTQGFSYLEIVLQSKKVEPLLPKLVKDDTGRPFRFSYPELGRISPTSLRYAKVLSDLDRLFGSLDGFIVSEIGVGFGGQCAQICNTYEISNYELLDLDPVVKLSEKYVKRVSPNANLILSGLSTSMKHRDLLISNYAFSELKRDVQEGYFESVVKNTPRGYVIYNECTPPEWGSLTAQEFSERIPGAEILNEVPLTYLGNVLVVWGHGNF